MINKEFKTSCYSYLWNNAVLFLLYLNFLPMQLLLRSPLHFYDASLASPGVIKQ